MMSGKTVLAVYNEEELRISISCKFHVFHDQDEMEKFYDGNKKGDITAQKIVFRLVRELEKRGVLQEGLTPDSPLYTLAPTIVREFILPFAPGVEKIESMWRES